MLENDPKLTVKLNTANPAVESTVLKLEILQKVKLESIRWRKAH